MRTHKISRASKGRSAFIVRTTALASVASLACALALATPAHAATPAAGTSGSGPASAATPEYPNYRDLRFHPIDWYRQRGYPGRCLLLQR